MKKINLRGLSEVLSEKELKNVLGGSIPVLYLEGVRYNCSCNSDGANPPYVSSWSDCYKRLSDIKDDIDRICKSGGSCTSAEA